MICPDRCTMELIGTYRGIKINEVYRCRHCTVTSYRSVEMDKEQLIAEMAVENAELRESLSQLNGLFAQDGVGIVEPLEGFAKRPQDLKRCVEELIDKLAAKDAELERIGSDLKSAWVHGYNTGHNAGISCGHPLAKLCRHDGAEEAEEHMEELTALASPAAEPDQAACAECGKSDADGWALYCVGCAESVRGEPVAWMCPKDPDAASAFSWKPRKCNCGSDAVPVTAPQQEQK